jgi:hypothetical protein
MSDNACYVKYPVILPGRSRLTFGPGYRIYFGMHGSTVVLLLLGGDKGSQVRNIQAAKRHWSDFVEAMKDGKAK